MDTRIVCIKPDAIDEKTIAQASEVIKNAGLVVFPTETVYGLGADATNPAAARKIYAAKGRPSDNPLIIHLHSPEAVEPYAYTTDTFYTLASALLPGPLTVVLRAKESIPKETRAGLDTVAVRIPENPIARALILHSGVPIAAPSANISGTPSPTRAEHVISDMSGRVELIIDGGDCDIGIESTIIRLHDDGGATLLRPGRITEDELIPHLSYLKIASAVYDKLKDGEAVISPGMKYRHYAPKAPLYLCDGTAERISDYIGALSGKRRVAVIAYEEDARAFDKIEGVRLYSFGSRQDSLFQAHLLFDLLRRIDKEGFDEIYAPLPDKSGVGLALYNRMIRAAAHQIIRL